MNPIRVDTPTVEPVSLSEMRDWLRLDPDDTGQDAVVASLIAAARGAVEDATRRILAPGRYRVTLTGWPASRVVPLPLSPLVALVRAGSVDAQGVVTDFAPGLVRLGPDPVEAPGLVIDVGLPPLLQSAALIEVAAGHGGDGPPAPPALLQAIRQLAAHWFEHRGDEPGAGALPPTVQALLAPHRRMRL